MKIVKSIWIFDVDGVITDPKEKKITEPEILTYIAKKIEAEEPVALNTGRSLVWMIQRVINPLLKKITNKKNLQNFFASGEKGGTWLTFDENGNMMRYKDESISVPLHLQEKIKNLINSEYSESMFYDATKETMISTEMKDGYPIKEYTEMQKSLNYELQNLVNNNGLAREFKIDPTTIATDVENIYVGKGFAIERILAWLCRRSIQPQKFITFGDSLSDLPMAEILDNKRKSVLFVYVGKNQIKQSFHFPIMQPKELFGKGTEEALRSL